MCEEEARAFRTHAKLRRDRICNRIEQGSYGARPLARQKKWDGRRARTITTRFRKSIRQDIKKKVDKASGQRTGFAITPSRARTIDHRDRPQRRVMDHDHDQSDRIGLYVKCFQRCHSAAPRGLRIANLPDKTDASERRLRPGIIWH